MDLTLVDRFLFLDPHQRGRVRPGRGKGTPWHPRRGFETVTLMMDGAFEHQDGAGGGRLIANSATRWMTAGPDPPHRETTGGSGHRRRAVPRGAAVGQPAGIGEVDTGAVPGHLRRRRHPARLARRGCSRPGHRRLARRHEGPGSTFTPITYLHLTVSPGARVTLPWPKDFNALVYVLSGRGLVGAEQRPLDEGQLAMFGSGDVVEVAAPESQAQAAATGWEILVLGGLPIGSRSPATGPS